MLDRREESEVVRREERTRPPSAPAPPLSFGTKAWASALGNAAVARIARAPALARAPAEAAEEAAPEAAAPVEPQPAEAAEAEPAEAAAAEPAAPAEPAAEGPAEAGDALDALPEDHLPE